MNGRQRNRLLALLFFGVLMAAMDIAIVGPALPAIRDAFGVSDREVSWVFTAYLLFNLIGTPLMAKLADRLGRRSVYVADVVLFAVGSVVVALAPSLAVVVVGRALQGFGAGGIFPVASAVIGDTFPPERRGRALGLIGSVFGIAFIIGPIFGGVLLRFGWQMLFWGPLPFALVLIPWAWRELPTTRAAEIHGLDWGGLLALSGFLAALTLGLNHLEVEHLAASLYQAATGGWLVAALILLGLLIWVETRAADPLVRPALFGTGQLRRVNGLAFGAGVIEGAMVFVPSLLVAALGLTPSQSSFALLPAVAAMAVGAPLFGRLLDARGSRLVVIVGTSLTTVGLAVLSGPSLSWPTFLTASVLFGLGLSALLGAPLRYIMLNEVPATERSAAQGVISLMTKIGQLVTGALVGALAASLGGGVSGYQSAFRVLTLVALGLVFIAWSLKSFAEERGRRDASLSRGATK
ncbi:MAG TPA: MFS transporter [Anaerolineae bacterium]|nr:MFS transporter [Anaerolineae bacterium]HID85346.1 MFS transporter [Anaerolineales bacterium]HIQ09525.1 MFS transporter [Anaerolineaceae bacterium]